MTPIVKAMCPACQRENELPGDKVTLHLCSTNAELSFYHFRCQHCQVDIRKPADRHVRTLLAGNVPVNGWRVPAEALERHEGPVIDLDYLITFALELRELPCPAALADTWDPNSDRWWQ